MYAGENLQCLLHGSKKSVPVIAGVIPIDLQTDERMEVWKNKKEVEENGEESKQKVEAIERKETFFFDKLGGKVAHTIYVS